MTHFDLEVGKLMAQFESLQQQIEVLNKGMENTNQQLAKLAADFGRFSGQIFEQMDTRFVRRSDLAPIKAFLSVAWVSTFSALCLTLSEIFLKRLF